MDHFGKHPQQQNPREETQRKRKERKRSAPAAAADELSRSKITQQTTKEKKRSGPATAAAAELSRSKTTQRKGKARKRQGPDAAAAAAEELSRKGYPRRDFTEEEYQAYKKKYDESDGFDVGDIPYDVGMPGISMPLYLDKCKLKPYNEMAESALDKFNKDHGTTYKFVKLIKGNGRFSFGMLCRLTFQAKDQESASPQNFQTLVHQYPKDFTVHFCRFEPKGGGETSQQQC